MHLFCLFSLIIFAKPQSVCTKCNFEKIKVSCYILYKVYVKIFAVINERRKEDIKEEVEPKHVQCLALLCQNHLLLHN